MISLGDTAWVPVSGGPATTPGLLSQIYQSSPPAIQQVESTLAYSVVYALSNPLILVAGALVAFLLVTRK